MRVLAVTKEVLRQILYALGPLLLVFVWGCGMKVTYLPEIPLPYVMECELLRRVEGTGNEVERIHFKDDRIVPPFYFFLKVQNVENHGELKVLFYRSQAHPLSQLFTAQVSFVQRLGLDLLTSSGQPAGLDPLGQRPEEGISRFMALAGTGVVGEALGALALSLGCLAQRIPVLEGGAYYYWTYDIEARLAFAFGENGSYYDHIIFIDKISRIPPGNYICAVFLRGQLLYETRFTVFTPSALDG